MNHEQRSILIALLTLGMPLGALGEDKPAAEKVNDQKTDAGPDEASLKFFEAKIRPVLAQHCYRCHSANAGKSEGELRVDTRKSLHTGGARGPAVVPGKPDDSWLLTAISRTDPDLAMPPRQKPLPDDVIADFRKWIKMGAPDPRAERVGPTPESASIQRVDRSFWAFQPPKSPAVPAVANTEWGRLPIDAFVLAKLEANSLKPSAEAVPRVLLRRLHFDLVGLPPSPVAIDEFLSHVQRDGPDAALAAEVDRLLASPQFGETWGRHWLDVARFGESSGGEANISFPYAWRYRDYVIDAVNADIPFDRFITEQIAGDLLPYDSDAERARLLTATGFLAVGPKNLDAADAKQFAADVIDEQIDAVTRAVMAHSVACARCHDHKFDPYSMEDYYALAGVFSSTKAYFGTAVSPSNRIGGDPLRLPDVDGQCVYHPSIGPKKVQQLRDEVAALDKEEKEKRAAYFAAVKEGKDPSGIVTLRDALRIFWTRGRIEGALEKVDEQGQAIPLTMGVLDAEKIRDAPLLQTGDVHKPGEHVARRFPEVIVIDGTPEIPADVSGRLQLARWLSHSDHPLTSRVIVNRIWSKLLGEGIVRTVDNFGSTGETPSHPELLDHLATRFVEEGWSIKQLVRDIVLTRTYRQASNFNPAAFHQDPENRLLWRAPKRRLPAEAIRDAMLDVSGELDLNRPEASLVGRVIGDRPISLIGLDKRLPSDLDGSLHRSAYLPVIRDRLPDVLDLFDFAEPGLVTGHRETTNVPIQALYLLNSEFVLSRSQALAKRLQAETDSHEQLVKRVYLLCFGRSPRDGERKRCLKFLKAESIPATPSSRRAGLTPDKRLTAFAQAILCMAEFRNLD